MYGIVPPGLWDNSCKYFYDWGRIVRDTRILVADDDPKIRSLLRRCFEDEGYIVSEADSERSVLAGLEANSVDLLTLDIALGSDDGFQVAAALRAKSAVPIIMVTGKDDVIDRVVGLELGADDYVTKPFHVREIVARVKSVLRRAGEARETMAPLGATAPAGSTYQFDGMTACLDRMELLDREQNVADLTSGDFKLLQLLLEHPKRALSRSNIMDMLNGTDWTPLDRTIDNQVARLRRKIERDPGSPKLIKTVRGTGYMFATEVERR